MPNFLQWTLRILHLSGMPYPCFPKRRPVLEIRFTGLKGVFKYLLDEMTEKTGDSFRHLDGESI
jgi:hypothetical protein